VAFQGSQLFTGSGLTAVPGLERQEILGAGPLRGAGLRVVEVPHEGNTSASAEEAGRVAVLVRDLLGCRWRDRDRAERAVGPVDILVITPYNAQVRAIREALGASRCPEGVRVGTVDKFQGRQGAVAIYSMATSSAEEAPRGWSFSMTRGG
jgi:superfamily I DNA and/or RNA helicase